MVMFKVNVFEAKARLSEYLDRAAAGERIIICRHNKPLAELRPLAAARTEPRPIGPLPGETPFEVPPSFFEPLADDELDRWEGSAAADPAPATAKRRPRGAGTRVAESRQSFAASRPGSRRRKS